MEKKKIVLCGGGTAGHVTPHLALLDGLKENNYEIYYVGSKNGIEKTIISKEGIDYKEISVGKLRRYFSIENIKDVFKVIKGIIQASLYLKKLKPDIVFSKGGFAAVPVVIGAKLNKVPIICHESDMTPGIATKISAKYAKKVALSFEECLKYFPSKGVYTGTAIRKSLFEKDDEKVYEKYGLSKKPILLIMGGSQGAQAINESIYPILDDLLKDFCIIHLCGKGKLNASLMDKKDYVQLEYLDKELANVLNAASLVISRSGSNSICELHALYKPMLLIPYPKGASRGDQILNAQNFEKKGFAILLMQDDLNRDTLLRLIYELQDKSEDFILNMQRYPAKNGSEEILKLILEHSK